MAELSLRPVLTTGSTVTVSRVIQECGWQDVAHSPVVVRILKRDPYDVIIVGSVVDEGGFKDS